MRSYSRSDGVWCGAVWSCSIWVSSAHPAGCCSPSRAGGLFPDRFVEIPSVSPWRVLPAHFGLVAFRSAGLGPVGWKCYQKCYQSRAEFKTVREKTRENMPVFAGLAVSGGIGRIELCFSNPSVGGSNLPGRIFLCGGSKKRKLRRSEVFRSIPEKGELSKPGSYQAPRDPPAVRSN